MEDDDQEQQTETIFPPVQPLYSRNFLIVDTHFVTPPISGLGVPGPDGDVFDITQNSLADVTSDVVSELPPDCLKAFAEVRNEESQWKHSWATENDDGSRARFKVDYNLST